MSPRIPEHARKRPACPGPGDFPLRRPVDAGSSSDKFGKTIRQGPARGAAPPMERDDDASLSIHAKARP